MLFDFFEPYLFWIFTSLIIIINLILIFKGINIYVILFFNIIVSITLNLTGLGEYDFLTTIINGIIDLLVQLLDLLFDRIADLINPFTSCQ
jgi:hypothetical protein